MTVQYWNCSHTDPHRYDYLGATGYVLSRTKHKNKVTIIDVGCSTGEAMAECKKCVTRHGARIHAIGIDMSREVAASAASRLDEFIMSNVLDVDDYKGVADIVLCLNVTRFVTWDVRHEIIQKCAWFLNNEGVLITGVDDEHIKKIELEPSTSTVPDCVCCEGGWKGRLRSWFKCDPRDTRMMQRSEAYHYADILMSGWQNKNLLKKQRIKMRIAYRRYLHIDFPKYTRHTMAVFKNYF